MCALFLQGILCTQSSFWQGFGSYSILHLFWEESPPEVVVLAMKRILESAAKSSERLNGLERKIIHSGFQATLLVSGHGIRSDRDDWHTVPALFLLFGYAAWFRFRPARAIAGPSTPRRNFSLPIVQGPLDHFFVTVTLWPALLKTATARR